MRRQSLSEWMEKRKQVRSVSSLPTVLVELSYESGNPQRLTLPLKLESRGNFRGHTRSRKHVKDVKHQRGFTQLMLQAKAKRWKLPLEIHLVRLAPSRVDKHENLPMCFKSVVDGICDWFGIDDRGDDIIWTYGQERVGVRSYGCRIEIGFG